MNGRACSLVRACAVRGYTVPVRGLGVAVYFLCGAMQLRTAYRAGCAVSVYSGTFEPHFTWVCVWYGDRHEQPKRGFLYVCACICACMTVGIFSPRVVPILVSTCMRACTTFGMYGPSGVRVAEKCVCVCLHSARRVVSERCAYRVYTIRMRVRRSVWAA